MNDSSAAVKTEKLTRRFGDNAAVDRLDLEVARGEIFGLVGPDGSGKTTTLRLLCGLIDPSEGTTTVAGFDTRTRSDAVKDRIGYMAQRFGLYVDLTVGENMEFYADLFGLPKPERRDLAARLLRMTRMEPFVDRPAGKLSGGMKQKLALMCTLLHRPEILFLDEPTNGVDPVSRRDFWAILYQLVKDGLTVVVSTSYLDEAERCNRVGLMHRGRMIRCGTPQSLKGSLEEECFELRTADVRAARTALEGAPGVLSAEPAGGTIHLFLHPSLTSPLAVRELLSQGGVADAQLERIEPSLEDVFIALIRKAPSEPGDAEASHA